MRLATKKCSWCKEDFPLDRFRKRSRILKSGTISEYYESACLKCEGKKISALQKKRYNFLKKYHPKMLKIYLEKHGEYNKISRNKGIRELSNRYVAQVLGIKNCKENLPAIEAKREQLKEYRKLHPNHKNIK